MQSKALSMPVAIAVVAIILVGIIAAGIHYANRPNISQVDQERQAKMMQQRQNGGR